MKRKRIFAILLVSLLLLAGAGYIYASAAGLVGKTASSQAGEATSVSQSQAQSQARLGSLTVSTSGTGQIVPVSELPLGFKQAGVLAELNVSAGDQVKAGDVLARLQVNQTPAQHEEAVASAKLAVIQASQALDQLKGDAEKATAQARVALEQAQNNLEDVQDNALAVAQAQQAEATASQAVQDAKTQLAILNAKPSQQAKDVAYSSLLFKEKDLQALDGQINRLDNQVKTAPYEMKDRMRQQLSSLRIKYIQQKADYEKRLAAYNSLEAPANPDELALAQAKLDTAQAQLAQAEAELQSAQAGPSAGDLAQAQVQLAQAQATYQRLKDGPDPLEVAKAEATLQAAQASLALAEADKLSVDLTAPSDGVVLSVSAEAGDRLAAGNFITLADMSQALLDVYLDETDTSMVKVGNKVNVVFDAFPDVTYTGEITQVDPSLVQENAVTPELGQDFFVAVADTAGSVRALVRLDVPPATKTAISPVGLNATVEVIAGQVQDAVLVPLEALHKLSSGEDVVYVVQGSGLQQRPVKVGLQDYTSAQIIDGLSAGETVALNVPTSTEGVQ